MPTVFKTLYKDLRQDTSYFSLMMTVVVCGILYTLYCLLAIHSSDTQVVSQYSGMGDIHFYKSKWYSLYTFAGFGVLVTIVHTVLLAKLHEAKQRTLGIVMGWIAILVIFIAVVYTYGVFHLAFL